jgi:hypothetical protein
MKPEGFNPGYECAFTDTDYYDGPRKGIANYQGKPHFYECIFHEAKDDYSELFRLTPRDSETYQLAMEDWHIWRCGEKFARPGDWKGSGLIAGALCFGSNHANLSNLSGEDSVPELQAKPWSSDDVQLDCTTAPGATVDSHSLRRYAPAIEPSAPNPVVTIAKRPERIEGIPRTDQHTIATA